MEKRKELMEFLDIARKVEYKEDSLLKDAVYDTEYYNAYIQLYDFAFSDEINGRLQDIHPFHWYDPDKDYEDDYKAWKFGLEEAVEEVKGLVSEDGASYRVNRQIIEEFCDKHMSPHTDWTGTRVETKGKCDSVDDFVDKLMEYIEENQHKY